MYAKERIRFSLNEIRPLFAPSTSLLFTTHSDTDHEADDASVGAEQPNKSLSAPQQGRPHEQQGRPREQHRPQPQRELSDHSLKLDHQQPQVDPSMAASTDASFEQDGAPSGKDGKAKKSKLKLLGVVPIPGTKKVYKEDRREKKAEKRIQKQARRPAWEANVSTGKY